MAMSEWLNIEQHQHSTSKRHQVYLNLSTLMNNCCGDCRQLNGQANDVFPEATRSECSLDSVDCGTVRQAASRRPVIGGRGGDGWLIFVTSQGVEPRVRFTRCHDNHSRREGEGVVDTRGNVGQCKQEVLECVSISCIYLMVRDTFTKAHLNLNYLDPH
ncbi:hypothetical protein J6590_061681 [Homalodisca vitripennis]|nr:hypothetical protein J6590_061681 [Homalodisca vitripennis]